mmetsp:Transcript_177500/g.569275  ORF Transcript_177500/g.569275 Transcript_177500/m.569275 type:complete len:862 (+) Transcript_177500:683-3268(+)
MPRAHGGVTQLAHQRHENGPLLDDVLNAHVGVALAVHLHLLQLLEQALDLVLHLQRRDLTPIDDQERFRRLDAQGLELPERAHVGDVLTHEGHALVGVVELIRIREVRRDVFELLHPRLELVQVAGDAVQARGRQLEAALVEVVTLLPQADLVRLELVLKFTNDLPVELALLLLHGLNLLLLGQDVILQLPQVRADLLQGFVLLVPGHRLLLQGHHRLVDLVLLQEQAVLLVVHVLDVVHHLDQAHDVAVLQLRLVAHVRGLVELVHALERALDPRRDQRTRELVRTVPRHVRKGRLEGRASKGPLLAVLVGEPHVEDHLALVGDVHERVLAVVVVHQLVGQIPHRILAILGLELLLKLDDQLVAPGLPVLVVRIPQLDRARRLDARLLLLQNAWAIHERLFGDRVEEKCVAGDRGSQVAGADLHAHGAVLRTNGAEHARCPADDGLVVDDLALSGGRVLSAGELDDGHAVRGAETDTSDGDLHLAGDRAQGRLHLENRVRRAHNGGDIDLPHIIQPFVRPATENDQPRLLGVVADRGVLSGHRPRILRLHVEVRLLPLVLVPKVQHPDPKVEDAAAAALAVDVGGAAEDEYTPGRDGFHQLQRAIPPRHAPGQVHVGPILVFDVQHEQVVECAIVVPAAENKYAAVLGEGLMPRARRWRVALAGELHPPGVVEVEHPGVVPGPTLIAQSSMSSEEDDGVLVEARCVVRPRSRHRDAIAGPAVVAPGLGDHGDELLVELLLVGRHQVVPHADSRGFPHAHAGACARRWPLVALQHRGHLFLQHASPLFRLATVGARSAQGAVHAARYGAANASPVAYGLRCGAGQGGEAEAAPGVAGTDRSPGLDASILSAGVSPLREFVI